MRSDRHFIRLSFALASLAWLASPVGARDSVHSAAAQAPSNVARESSSMKIRLLIDGQHMTATLDDSATARDFLAQLPLTLQLEDYASTEKIAQLPRRLSTAGAAAGVEPAAGDLAFYAPW